MRPAFHPPVAVALDAPDVATAEQWAAEIGPHVSVLKLGLEFYLSAGADGVLRVRRAARECGLFLDLKLHDIPNTVAAATRVVAGLRPDFLTVHALGGPSMVAAAAEALPGTRITAVTILTSMSEADLAGVGIKGTPAEAVLRLAEMSVAAGAGALVCSPQEVAAVRGVVGDEIVLITPGVRPPGAHRGDQQRVATPAEALSMGADLLVIGRPITGAHDRAEAASRVLTEGAQQG
ncbi:MAG TPA: orotidine-5'-phosphate decarboxylase [Actinomycetes bacterium]|nr:orotidine-5'-phosphate decarboxylase [Actinomycetes bacterium]